MSPFGLKFSHMILHTEASKLVYNWSFVFVVLHQANTRTQYLLYEGSTITISDVDPVSWVKYNALCLTRNKLKLFFFK